MRVSTLDQNEKRQLEGQVLDRVFTDKASGRDTSKPELTELVRFVRDGDTVVVHSMDRLARNLDDLRALVQTLTRKGVRVEFVKGQLVFTGEDSPMANLMLSVMGAFAEFERELKKLHTSCLILQCSDDRLAPPELGAYLHKNLEHSTLMQLQATGHCPHVSAPEETARAILHYLHTRS